jgi:hypothetical protein
VYAFAEKLTTQLAFVNENRNLIVLKEAPKCLGTMLNMGTSGQKLEVFLVVAACQCIISFWS